MSERYSLEDRYKIEGRLIFIKSLENEIQPGEDTVFSSYKEICEKILTERLQISKHKRDISHYESIRHTESETNTSYRKNNYATAMIDFAENEISQATARLNDLEAKALNLENTEVIQNLYNRAYLTVRADHNNDLADLLGEKVSKFEIPATTLELQPPQKQAMPVQDTPKQKQVNHTLLKDWWVSNGDDILKILSWVFTGLWYGYIAEIVFTSDSNIVGKIFFLIWSFVLAFIILVHNSRRNK